MGVNCASLLSGLFLYLYESEFIKNLQHEKGKNSRSGLQFRWTLRHIDDVLFINNNQFHSYIDSVYPNVLEIKDASGFSTSASYLDILLKLDTNGKLTSQLYDKTGLFRFLHRQLSFPM
jgi:hypothetical protein